MSSLSPSADFSFAEVVNAIGDLVLCRASWGAGLLIHSRSNVREFAGLAQWENGRENIAGGRVEDGCMDAWMDGWMGRVKTGYM